jgi:predicted PurR-regulated permease PerM
VRNPRANLQAAELSSVPRALPWSTFAHAATIGIFAILCCAVLYFARVLIAPIVAAAVVATMFGPAGALADRLALPRVLYALFCMMLVFFAVDLLFVVLSEAIGIWTARLPEIGSAIKGKFNGFQRFFGALGNLEENVSVLLGKTTPSLRVEPSMTSLIGDSVQFLTPALSGVTLFLVSMFFFLISRKGQRKFVVFLFDDPDVRLRTLRALTDVERSLARYVGVVTLINVAVGIVTAAITYFAGFQSPMVWGAAAFLLNYVPYLGPAIIMVLLFTGGLVELATLSAAFIAPAIFVLFTTIEGHFITPAIVGRQLTVNPLLVFLAIAFWTWLWGPVGTFLATPFTIIGAVVYQHVVRENESLLPD